MSEYLPVMYQKEDTCYVKSIGYEDNFRLAHWGPGYRDYCILHFVISGRGYYNGNDVSENQGFFITAGQLHEYHSDTEHPWTYCWIIFSEELAKKYALPVLRPDENQIFSCPYIGKLKKLFQNIFAEYNEMTHVQALDNERLDICIDSLQKEDCDREKTVLEMIRMIRSVTDFPKQSVPVVERIKKILETDLAADFFAKELANQLGISWYYMCHLFKKTTGVTVVEYRNALKITKAKEL